MKSVMGLIMRIAPDGNSFALDGLIPYNPVSGKTNIEAPEDRLVPTVWIRVAKIRSNPGSLWTFGS